MAIDLATNNTTRSKPMKTVPTHYRKLLLCFGLLLAPQFSQTETVPSESPPKVAPTETVQEPSPEGPIQKTSDPFANTMEMLRRVTENNPVASTISALTGSMDMRLRGSVIDGDGNALALLELAEGQVHVVKVGDTLSLRTHGKNSSVKIMAIHRQSVELEFGDFEDYVVVR